jgi:hypothetical protein
VFEQLKTVHVLDHDATKTRWCNSYKINMCEA